MSERFDLTPMQSAYIAGKYMKSSLGGVSCHVYIEIEAENVDFERLENAWKKVIDRHPFLSAVISDGEMVTGKSRLNEKVIFFDLRNRKDRDEVLEGIRENFSHRQMHIEYGHTCGLLMSLIDEKKLLLHFDYDVSSGDVLSFYRIIGDLERIYCGENLEKSVIPNRKEISGSNYPCEWLEDLPEYPKLPMQTDPEKMHSCRYKVCRCEISSEDWKRFYDTYSDLGIGNVLAAIFAKDLYFYTGQKDILLNIPAFPWNNEDERTAVMDRTVLQILPINGIDNKNIPELAKDIRNNKKKLSSNENHILDEKTILSAYPERTVAAPIVFSEISGEKLISGSEMSPFKKIRYLTAQTPQVYLDVQVYEAGNEMFTCFIYPDGLYLDDVIDNISAKFKEMIISADHKNL